MRVTLDRNELIHIDHGTGDSTGLRELTELHSRGIIKLCVPAIAGSERQRDGTTLESYTEFQAFLASVNLDNYEELLPMGYIGITYIDHCLVSSPEMENLERRVHDILFPSLQFYYHDFLTNLDLKATSRVRRRWLNAKCDVQAIWSHIWHGADIFVTEDNNFHKVTKKQRLRDLGARYICRPSEAVSNLQAVAGRS